MPRPLPLLIGFPVLTYLAAYAIVGMTGFEREGFDLAFNAAALAFGIGALVWTFKHVTSPEK